MSDNSNAGDRLQVIVLAAGASARLGTPKQLVRFRNQSLIRLAALAAVEASKTNVSIVLGANSRQVEGQLKGLEAKLILNSDWRDGLASSIRKGLLTLPPARQAILLMPCDLPLLSGATLGVLIEHWNSDRSRIIISKSGRCAGLPAIIPRRYFKALMSIKGDPGISSFFARHRDFCDEIALTETELDIDTEADLQELRSRELAVN